MTCRGSVREADVDPGRRVVRRVELGAGEPAVVLEAWLNNGAASWQRVMPLRPRTARCRLRPCGASGG